MSRLRRRLRRLRRWLGYGLLFALIGVALLVAVASQLLPLVHRHPDAIARWLSERSGQALSFTTSEAYWTRRGPLFVVDGLRVGTGDTALDIGRAELLVNIYAGLLPGQSLTELRLRGIPIALRRDLDGRWSVSGLHGRPAGGGLAQLEALGVLAVEDAQLQLSDARRQVELSIPRIDIRARVAGGRLHAGAVAYAHAGGPLHVVVDVDLERVDGRLYVGGDGLALAQWTGALGAAGTRLVAGAGDLQLWATLDRGDIASVQVEAALDRLRLAGDAPVGDAAAPPQFALDGLALSGRWLRGDAPDRWRLDLARLRLASDGDAAPVVADGIGLHRDGSQWRLSAPLLPLTLPARLAVLPDVLPAGLRARLGQAAPEGALRDVAFVRDGERWSAVARMEGVAWQADAAYPGVSGLAGRLLADERGLRVDFAPTPVRVAWPGAFRQPFELRLGGGLAIWPQWPEAPQSADADAVAPSGEAAAALDDVSGHPADTAEPEAVADAVPAPRRPDWHIAAVDLSLRGPDWSALFGGGLLLEAGERLPTLDLAVEVGAAPVVASKQFWFVRKMTPPTVRWLDTALQGGTVLGGRAVFSGSLADWPFDNRRGVFLAEAHVADARVAFHPDWPVAEGVDAVVRFVNNGLEFESVSGRLLDSVTAAGTGAIPSFRDPRLILDLQGGGSGPDLLALLLSSPVRARYGEALAGVRIGGRGDAQVHLDVPLKASLGPLDLAGTVDLQQADLEDSQRDLRFDGAQGRVRFSEDGFSADALQVRYGEAPATLALAAGAYTGEPGNAFEASLRGRLPVQALLDRAPELDWLRPYLDGAPAWDIAVSVPREGRQRLRLRSDLDGLAIGLPAPLRKAADAPMPLDLQLDLPPRSGALDLHLGHLMHLRGHWPDGDALAAHLGFGGGDGAPLPAQGIEVGGQVPVLDAVGWAGLAAGGRGEGLALGRIALDVAQLDVAGRVFHDTRVAVLETPAGRRIELDGPALAGSVELPALALLGQDGIAATFQRLHWPAGRDDGPPLGAGVLPSSLPPLRLQVDDLRAAGLRFGAVTLRTHPTPEGLHVEQARADGPLMRVQAQGDWQVIGGRERSSFGLQFESDDLGALLAEAGFGGLIDRGPTKATLDATWPGSPAAFALQSLDGTVALDVGKGRVRDVDPGAGRVLGLFSLTELPRRLALDFRDFFESGLAFNTIRGRFVLDGGNAFTEDLDIEGPAASIRIRGRTGLKARDYDQTIEVLPRASGVLTVVGAIAGGPAGAAIGAVAQAALQQPLGQMTRTLYRVHGGWAEPQLDVLERGPARTTP